MKSKPLFAFFGTSAFVIPALEALERAGYVPALVITAPDRPQGRGMKLAPSPVKQWALDRHIDVVTPEKIKDDRPAGGFVAEMRNTDWDLFIVASYAKILPKALLDIPRRGCLNIHPSLLPKFRGPSPFLSAILADERHTGVTIMQMAEAMDTGPIIAQAKVEIDEADWPPPSDVLSKLLFSEGGTLLAEILPDWMEKKVEPHMQDERLATYTKKYTKKDALLDLTADPRQNFLKIRAFDVNPRAYFMTPDGKRVVVTDAAWHDGQLEILKVIPEGKKGVNYADFVRGNGGK